jgi:hypothetical protein
VIPAEPQYSVQVIDVRQPRHPVWGPIAVRAAAVRYPDDAPALQAGTTYLVHVETGGGARSPTEGVGFHLLPEEKLQVIMHRRAELQRKIAQDSAQQLALAAYYMHQQLRSEALALLDTLVQQSTSAPVHLLRAHVLRETQLIQAAFQQYEHARRLAAQQHDFETQAEALVGLARTTEDRASIRQYYQEAMALFQALDERERAGKLEEEIRSAP